MKKVKVKSLDELPETEEWTEIEFMEPIVVESVLKKTVKKA
jgi:hypothetical protein